MEGEFIFLFPTIFLRYCSHLPNAPPYLTFSMPEIPHEHNSDDMEVDKLKAEIKSLKEQLAAKFEKYAGNYSNDPDKKMAELMTRNAVLETELENYQKYMKAATKKYEAKIKKLKKKLKG